MIDLRSDTVTQPTPGMLKAMTEAELGDDVFGDDPTVHLLEKTVAEILGKEAAVFMPSGTMANQVAIRVQTQPGDEIFLEESAHIYLYEAGGPAALSGVMPRLIKGDKGIFTAKDIQALLRPVNDHFPRTRLVCIENTHNRGGGTIWPLENLRELRDFTKERKLGFHLDGARLWNAVAGSEQSEKDITHFFDTVSVCFSKGLGAPVGSALCGSADFIQQARRVRKLFGGGMRQSGILAAAALYSLNHHREKLCEDHRNAKRLAEGIAKLPAFQIDPSSILTNIVIFEYSGNSVESFLDRLNKKGVALVPFGGKNIRAVTHLGITRDDIETALQQIEAVQKNDR